MPTCSRRHLKPTPLEETMKTKEIILLPATSPGSQKYLEVLRYGTEGGRKVYIQAGLHADEAPGFLVAHHLQKLLNVSEVHGQIVLVPLANPIGLSQWRDETLQGRFHFSNSLNFNRHYSDLTALIAEKLQGQLQNNPDKNIKHIRQLMKDGLETLTTEDDAEFLKKTLLSLACDADIVLDLHCDHEALFHIYLGTPLWPDASDLAAHLGAEVTLLAKDSGDNPFDEACSRIWWDLAERFPEYPIPPACLAATVELRGSCDTDPGMAERDALNILRFLQGRNIIAGKAPHRPPMRSNATPLTGVDYVKAHVPGIVTYLKDLGAKVQEGDAIAQITNPLPEEGHHTIHTIISRTSGTLFTRNRDRFAYPGRIIAKIAGDKPLRSESDNLLTQ